MDTLGLLTLTAGSLQEGWDSRKGCCVFKDERDLELLSSYK